MTTPTHLGGAYNGGDSNTLVFDVFGYLIVKYELKSMIDVGTGYGHVPKWFSGFLVDSTGIDGDEVAIKESVYNGALILHDFTLGPAPIPKERRYGLGWSSEFVEHVEERFIPNYMPIFQQCDHVVITHAEPGQPGHHHVTLKDTDWWVDTFRGYGLEYDPEETALIRKTDRWGAGWGRRTMTVFHNKS